MSRGRRTARPGKNPLAEIFGYLPEDMSPDARRHRDERLCPFSNIVPQCTKSSVDDPLGVCSVLKDGTPVITCPVRFRQDWLIAQHAASFFFGGAAHWIALKEVPLLDRDGKSAGNIDVVLATHDGRGALLDFGALEVQAVYISGNVRKPFQRYMEGRAAPSAIDWSRSRSRPNPDYLSSSRKRLAPQLLYKGGILRAWGKKQAVAIQEGFYRTLPPLPVVSAEIADLLWLIYDLVLDTATSRYTLELKERVYTQFEPALLEITTPHVGDEAAFRGVLQSRLAALLGGSALPPEPISADEEWT